MPIKKSRSRHDKAHDIDSDINSLSDKDIEQFFKAHFNAAIQTQFGGVYSKDTVPYKDLNPFTIYVVNTAKEADPGEHWLSLTTTADTSTVKHFDSYGLDPLNNEQYTLEQYKQFKQIIKTSPGDLQAEGTAVCGEYVCVNSMFENVVNSTFQDQGFTWDKEMEMDQEAKRSNDLRVLSIYQQYNNNNKNVSMI